METQLTIKHLAAYFPYGLKILRPDNKTILEMVGIIGSSIVFHEESGDTFGFIGKHNKPILRPLSDLTKEIEVNGEKVIVKNLIDDIRRFIDVFRPFNVNNDLELNYETSDYSVNINFFEGYDIVQILLEYHFDVFGLIHAGLAIDINTLER